MNAQQLHDYIIKPTLEYMGGNYYSKDASFLLLCTAAIESDCGEFIKQVNGPALGIWQMEPATHDDVWVNCDALKNNSNLKDFLLHSMTTISINSVDSLISSPMYACAMARLKYAMDPKHLPKYTGKPNLDLPTFYEVYKRVYNTAHGKSTFDKWCEKINLHRILKVEL